MLGLISAVHTKNDHSRTENHYEIKPQITFGERNQFHQDINHQINASQAQLVSVSGSNNHGTFLNDAQFNLTTLIDRPIILQLHQQPFLLYVFIFSITLPIFFLLFICLYRYYRQQPSNRIRSHRYQSRSTMATKRNRTRRKKSDLSET